MSEHAVNENGRHAAPAPGGVGDYNAAPLPPSTLPPISGIQLMILGLTLGALLLALVNASFKLSKYQEAVGKVGSTQEAEGRSQ